MQKYTMKHTRESIAAQARRLAGGMPITRATYKTFAARIWGCDGFLTEDHTDITDKFTSQQLNAWADEVLIPSPEYREESRPRMSTSDWLDMVVSRVLCWQTNAALLPPTRAFAARIKHIGEDNESGND